MAKKEDQAAKKILLASVEAEKKLRRSEPGAVSVDPPKEEHAKVDDHPTTTSKKQSEVAMIKLRVPNGKVPDKYFVDVVYYCSPCKICRHQQSS